ncbi:hypothetical protein [Mycolicibacterium porcinum]|uniref:Uncharacterized protein n=1 Tax=Mycolicibacterium porcinum TaxID=39693 RepID=A0ABV3VPY5_9MYCO
MTSTAATHDPTVLVGKWFHTTAKCPCPVQARVARWQGHILGVPAPGVILVELFEWILGEPNGQQLITVADFMGRDPVLYDGVGHMRYSHDHGALRHTSDCPGGDE